MGLFSSIFGKKDNSELIAAIADGAYLVDVRSAAEFKSGSVPGAVNIPVESIPQQLSKLANKPHIVVFCRSGNRSGYAKSLLENAGITNVINGGTWQNVNQVVNS